MGEDRIPAEVVVGAMDKASGTLRPQPPDTSAKDFSKITESQSFRPRDRSDDAARPVSRSRRPSRSAAKRLKIFNLSLRT